MQSRAEVVASSDAARRESAVPENTDYGRVRKIMRMDEQIPLFWHPLRTAGVLLWAVMPFAFMGFFFVLCTIRMLWVVIIPYLLWILMIDDAPNIGKRRLQWLRSSAPFRWMRSYFPISLVKSVDLDPNRSYLFAYHPHGIIGFGAVTSFATEACGFGKMFPGITMHVLTLASNFNMPLYREILLGLGFCSVAKVACERILRKGPGNAILIVVGGAQESLNSRPGELNLTLKRRFGFVRVAIRTGSDLVPVLAFGENDIYMQAENNSGSWLYWFQQKFKSIFMFTIPLIVGRGVMPQHYGIFPYMRPIHVVVGRPIQVPHLANPKNEVVAEVHAQYIRALQGLYDEYKDIYAADRISELRFSE
ncbi:Dga1p [Malassezia vespertilionis]|uniref:Diacylglycerol O-acyltransferase n=1 Tax=Malassezia vespertilionis TaxID=2020962 RepID=A0A2N1JDD5_9BASI|nr:Dga1p [Malassezia vespertilionis]